MLTIERAALDQLSALLNERAGLKIPPDGYHSLRLALTDRMPAVGITDAHEYVRRLKMLAGEAELRALLPLVTVGKTEFFRDGKQFHALRSRLIPEAMRLARREGRKIRLWSAGCATGEEPYSLAMVLAELGAMAEEVDLWATDLNPAAVEAASAGIFPARRMTGVSEEKRERFFEFSGGHYKAKPELRRYIRFEGQNLAQSHFHKVEAGSLDLILCRNVIIYFDLPTIRGLMDRFLVALAPTGTLLLGYSESLFKVYDRFQTVEVEEAFVYRRPSPAAKKTQSTTSLLAIASEPVRRKSGELALVAPKPRPQIPVVPEVRHSPEERLAEAIVLIQSGQFEAALTFIQRLLDDERNHLPSLLTLANLYSLLGKPQEASELFASVLQKEPLCVEAHLFAGAASLQSGNAQAAQESLRRALFLEPTLALGHYLLAQAQEKISDHVSARRSYRNAVAQLRFSQRPLAGFYPELPESAETVGRAARYALAALEEL